MAFCKICTFVLRAVWSAEWCVHTADAAAEGKARQLTALRECCAVLGRRGLLWCGERDSSSNTYHFVSELVREALHESLPFAQRVRLHEALADQAKQQLQLLSAGSHLEVQLLALVAHHLTLARQHSEAHDFLERAAEGARSLDEIAWADELQQTAGALRPRGRAQSNSDREL